MNIDFNLLAQKRVEAGLTQVELADLAQLSPVLIKKYEAGESTPRSKNLEKLADALGMTAELLVLGYNETHIDEPAGTKTMGVAEIPDDAPTPNIAESSEEQDDLGRLPLVVACLIDILPSSGEHISARQARSFCKAFEVMMKVGYADRLE